MKFLLSLFTLILTLSSCDSSKKALKNNTEMQKALSGTYHINQIENTDVTAEKIIISFYDNTKTISGFAACNNFFGTYTIENNTIKFNNIGASKKFCSKEKMNFENQFLKYLNTIDYYTINDNTISFSSNGINLIQGTSKAISSSKKDETIYKNNKSVQYKAIDRTSFNFISISKSRILLSKDRNLITIDKYNIDSKEWEDVNSLIEAINVEEISNLKAPSKKHQYDGAAHATLTIIIGDVEYTTPTFDHGNPPKAIEALVNKVLSIKENIIKQ